MRLHEASRRPFIALSFALSIASPAVSLAENRPPFPAVPVLPSVGNNNVQVYPTLAWDCVDPDTDPLTFDVYFGTESPPALVASNVTDKTWRPDFQLEIATTYYWMIDAHDPYGQTARSAVFDFTTQVNQAPFVWSRAPLNDAHGVAVWQPLVWTGYDESPASLRYDVYFGKQTPPPLVATDIASSTYRSGDLLEHGTTYYWRIVARDEQGLEHQGIELRFTTARVPQVNSASVPPNNGCVPPAEYIPPPDSTLGDATVTLQWSVTQPNGLPMHCSVYFGETAPTEDDPLPLLAGNLAPSSGTKQFSYGLRHTIEAGKSYFWQIVVNDAVERQRGPVWSFTGCGEPVAEPDKAIASAPYPNPFNPETTIPYVVPAGASPVHVRLVIYDAAGRMVRTLVNEKQAAGARSIAWNGKNASNQPASSGVYFCVIQVGTERRTQKLVMVR